MPGPAPQEDDEHLQRRLISAVTTSILSPTWLARLFAEGVEKHPLAEIAPGALTVRGKTGTQRLIYSQLDGVRVERGLFWSAVIIQRLLVRRYA
ncbi:hypothetical protein [uncultured Lamprocystis sp.]|jgi:hypothetical protein|uniref:hypothetical protein n=1 Tax=uncultured Lamprocystis sp. TaxID=543132 RepID=UPI0025F75D67|nr:hypothetical protein [uncultured Lamprocystis sp.]